MIKICKIYNDILKQNQLRRRIMKINNIFKIIGICSIIAPIPVTLFFLKPTY